MTSHSTLFNSSCPQSQYLITIHLIRFILNHPQLMIRFVNIIIYPIFKTSQDSISTHLLNLKMRSLQNHLIISTLYLFSINPLHHLIISSINTLLRQLFFIHDLNLTTDQTNSFSTLTSNIISLNTHPLQIQSTPPSNLRQLRLQSKHHHPLSSIIHPTSHLNLHSVLHDHSLNPPSIHPPPSTSTLPHLLITTANLAVAVPSGSMIKMSTHSSVSSFIL